MTTTIAKAVRSFPAPSGYKGRIVVTAELHSIGNQKPYFSVTGAIGTARELQSGNWQAGGCLHDEALAVWPAIAPVIRLHLSDEDGVPMHAVDNGFYWAAKAAGREMTYQPEQSPEECLVILSWHLRVSTEKAQMIVDCIRHCIYDPTTYGPAKDRFAEFVEELKPQWKAEADSGLALIRSFSTEEAAA